MKTTEKKLQMRLRLKKGVGLVLLLMVIVLAVALSLIFSLYPSIKASNIDPSDALRAL